MYQLTPEQQIAVHASRLRQNMRIRAFAGAGKTSTLTSIARENHELGVYIAFNKAIADDAARKFPPNITCKTAHSFAFRAVIAQGYSSEKMGTSPRSTDFRLRSVNPFSDAMLRHAVFGTLKRFWQSADHQITGAHVPRVPGFDNEQNADLRGLSVSRAVATWERMMDPVDVLPMGHDGYLKLWQLSRPRIPASMIMVDEAQDLNPVLIDIVANQPHAQLISVGDSHQQIYEWRGARDALNILPGDDLRLTRSFRFGPVIAEQANRVLSAMGEAYPLLGHEIADSVNFDPASWDDPDAVLCRSNSGVIGRAIGFLAAGDGVYVPGGVGQLRALVFDAIKLEGGRPAESAELLGFENWRAVEMHSKTEEGEHLKVFVSLVKQHGTRALLSTLDKISERPRSGDVTVSTAHKAKGLEWSTVEINDDFQAGDKIGVAEQRLFYVAITRAQHALNVNPEIFDRYTVATDGAY